MKKNTKKNSAENRCRVCIQMIHIFPFECTFLFHDAKTTPPPPTTAAAAAARTTTTAKSYISENTNNSHMWNKKWSHLVCRDVQWLTGRIAPQEPLQENGPPNAALWNFDWLVGRFFGIQIHPSLWREWMSSKSGAGIRIERHLHFGTQKKNRPQVRKIILPFSW